MMSILMMLSGQLVVGEDEEESSIIYIKKNRNNCIETLQYGRSFWFYTLYWSNNWRRVSSSSFVDSIHRQIVILRIRKRGAQLKPFASREIKKKKKKPTGLDILTNEPTLFNFLYTLVLNHRCPLKKKSKHIDWGRDFNHHDAV